MGFTREDAAESSKAAEARGNPPNPTEKAPTLKQQVELEIHSSVAKQTEHMKVQLEKEVEAQKIEDGETPPLRSRGMNLTYVAPVMLKGIPTAQLRVDEIESESAKWKFAVILYVIGESPTISYLKNYLKSQCNITGNVEIYYHNDGYFVVKCESGAEKEKLLFEGPYMIASRPVIIKEWRANFCLEDEVLKEVPLWIRLPNLPLHCWSVDSLSRIGSVIGRPLCADECTSHQSRISYARMLVEVDITKPLVYKIPITGENGLELLQQVYYEWVPLFCQKCQKVGHMCREKAQGTRVQEQAQKQWIPKDKGHSKESATERKDDEWQQPRNSVPASITVGNIPVPTDNIFQDLSVAIEGGDLFPSDGT